MSRFVQPVQNPKRYLKQQKATNIHITEARTTEFVAFLLEKWLKN